MWFRTHDATMGDCPVCLEAGGGAWGAWRCGCRALCEGCILRAYAAGGRCPLCRAAPVLHVPVGRFLGGAVRLLARGDWVPQTLEFLERRFSAPEVLGCAPLVEELLRAQPASARVLRLLALAAPAGLLAHPRAPAMVEALAAAAATVSSSSPATQPMSMRSPLKYALCADRNA